MEGRREEGREENEKYPEEGNFEAAEELSDAVDAKVREVYYTLPPPLFPTINGGHSWKSKIIEKRKSFTKNQIIDLYCANK